MAVATAATHVHFGGDAASYVGLWDMEIVTIREAKKNSAGGR